MNQSRRWCFTLNNYTSEEGLALCNLDCKYSVIGKEVGESGTPHLQGYVVFDAMKRLAALKKINGRAHWEVAKGTTEQNIKYCTKEGDYIENGEKPKSYKENSVAQKEKWQDIIKCAKEGKLLEEWPQYYATNSFLRSLYNPHLESLPEIEAYWYYGEPGTGKSRRAREENPDAYEKLLNKWWDNYNYEEVVIIDDLDKNHVHMGSFLKRYADHYRFRVEVKGGTMMIRPKKIIVTSNYTIEEIWHEDPPMVAALSRRFKQVRFSQIKMPNK